MTTRRPFRPAGLCDNNTTMIKRYQNKIVQPQTLENVWSGEYWAWKQNYLKRFLSQLSSIKTLCCINQQCVNFQMSCVFYDVTTSLLTCLSFLMIKSRPEWFHIPVQRALTWNNRLAFHFAHLFLKSLVTTDATRPSSTLGNNRMNRNDKNFTQRESVSYRLQTARLCFVKHTRPQQNV